jgi:isoleucyl-tRNA synthetase
MELVYFAADVVVEREVVATGWLVESAGPYVAALDPELTPELAREGLARELVHQVQRMRREAGFALSDRIALGIEGPAAVLEAAGQHRDFIATETLARALALGEPGAGADVRQVADVDGQQVTFSMRRHGA